MSYKKGFTLVELSIVLVIIGLLIGGILVAQSLIGSSKTQALVRQIGQFDAAVASFKDRYRQLPGDCSCMGIAPGNDDGVIQYSGGVTYYYGEIAKFWNDLAVAGLKAEDGVTFSDKSSNSASTTDYLPRAKLGNGAKFIGFGASGANYYAIANFNEATINPASTITFSDAFLAADVLALDSKMDDGLAGDGNVKAVDTTSATSITAATGGLTTGTDCSTTAGGDAYDVAEEAETCSIRVRMGSTTGTLY